MVGTGLSHHVCQWVLCGLAICVLFEYRQGHPTPSTSWPAECTTVPVRKSFSDEIERKLTCASLPALCRYSVGIWRCLQTRSRDLRLFVPSPSSAAKRSEVSMTKIPWSGVMSGKTYVRPANGASIALDLRYLHFYLDPEI